MTVALCGWLRQIRETHIVCNICPIIVPRPIFEPPTSNTPITMGHESMSLGNSDGTNDE